MNDDQMAGLDAEGNGVIIPNPAFSRRTFLAATGVTGAAVVALAVAKPAFASAPSGMTPTEPAAKSTGKPSAKTDLATAAFAAGLEVLAVGTYQAALDAATAGKLGAVPPAGATFVQTALGQHKTYLTTLNGVLTQNGQAAVTAPNAALKQTVDTQFAGVKDFVGAAKLARELEEISSATYLKAIPTLTPETAQVAGSILAVGQQRVAILNYVLGEYPVPEVFAKTDKAATAS